MGGIYDTGLEEFDKNFILGDLALVQRMNDWDEGTAGHYEVFLKNFNNLDLKARQISDEIDRQIPKEIHASYSRKKNKTKLRSLKINYLNQSKQMKNLVE